ncbi:unnamed protein product [Protopolystoma xenopodis]|uniref:Uncharacterized protein n=1 Tax=Protopolystoma xenopodis TaxID=117903 RepID=A0A3S5AZP1_9PLAT|nr:unnamed protein product [Protopolystoma xenopodis]
MPKRRLCRRGHYSLSRKQSRCSSRSRSLGQSAAVTVALALPGVGAVALLVFIAVALTGVGAIALSVDISVDVIRVAAVTLAEVITGVVAFAGVYLKT